MGAPGEDLSGSGATGSRTGSRDRRNFHLLDIRSHISHTTSHRTVKTAGILVFPVYGNLHHRHEKILLPAPHLQEKPTRLSRQDRFTLCSTGDNLHRLRLAGLLKGSTVFMAVFKNTPCNLCQTRIFICVSSGDVSISVRAVLWRLDDELHHVENQGRGASRTLLPSSPRVSKMQPYAQVVRSIHSVQEERFLRIQMTLRNVEPKAPRMVEPL